MRSRTHSFIELVSRLLLAALVIGLVARGVWEALRFGWSVLGVAA